jgi:hypothetical protein
VRVSLQGTEYHGNETCAPGPWRIRILRALLRRARSLDGARAGVPAGGARPRRLKRACTVA